MYTVHSVHMYEVCMEYCILNVYTQEAKYIEGSISNILLNSLAK
jgi:hypothetical protein